jgi:hypothetical protein
MQEQNATNEDEDGMLALSETAVPNAEFRQFGM